MSHTKLFALAALVCALVPLTACALGADHPKNQPVGGNSHWPKGLAELVNRPERGHGYFVNSFDEFFFDGDAAALNRFLDGYAKLDKTELRVVLHPGPKKAASPWDQVARDEPVSWSLQTAPHPLDGSGPPAGQGPFRTRVDVWLGGKVGLGELRVPAGVEVASGGEIEAFVAGRKSK